jgi:hypothetical protein
MPVVLSQYQKQSLFSSHGRLYEHHYKAVPVVVRGSLGSTTFDEPVICAVQCVMGIQQTQLLMILVLVNLLANLIVCTPVLLSRMQTEQTTVKIVNGAWSDSR